MLKDYLTAKKDRITIKYKDKDEEFIEQTFQALKNSVNYLAEYFELKEDFPFILAVLVLDRSEYDRLVTDLLKVKIKLPSDPWRIAQPQRTDLVILSPSAYEKHSLFTFKPDDYNRLLFHEVVHMFEEYLTPDMEKTPRYWGEGLAVYLSSQWKYEDDFRGPVVKAISDKNIPSIFEIEKNIKLCYQWGWTIVRYIEDSHGKSTILKIVRECDDGNIFKILNVNDKTFQKNWTEYLHKLKA